MRVVYSTRPYHGHLHPFVPLGRELLARGHGVAVATGPEIIPLVQQTGFAWLPAGVHPIEAEERFPDDDPDYGVEVLRAKVNDLLEVIMTWYRPQLVIREPTDLAAAIAAEVSGTPCVSLGVSRFIPASSWIFLAEEPIRILREMYRLPADPEMSFLYRGLYLDTVPPSWEEFEGPPPDGLLPVGYQPWDGDGDLPTEWGELESTRPTVLATLGTVYNDYTVLFDLFLSALDDPNTTVICTTGTASAPLSTPPPNLRIVDYVPHSAILPHCRALVCHGGFNTVMGAMACGVPMVCVPLGSDHKYNAERCEQLGAGIKLDLDGLTPQLLRDAVHTVLTEPSYAAAAGRIKAEIEAQPNWTMVSVVLEQLAQPRLVGVLG